MPWPSLMTSDVDWPGIAGDGCCLKVNITRAPFSRSLFTFCWFLLLCGTYPVTGALPGRIPYWLLKASNQDSVYKMGGGSP